MIRRVEFASGTRRNAPVTVIRLDVSDPNSDLGPQVLAFDARTGRVYALDPRKPVASLKANYPDGTYQVALDPAAGPVDPRDWHFIIADHYCQTTDILSYPHAPVPPRVVL